MKRIVGIILGVIFLTGSGLIAQERNGKQDHHSQKERMNEMNKQAKEDLGLSDEQAKEWNSIQKDFKQEKDAIRNEEGLSQDERKAKQVELRTKKDEAIKGILTEEQYVSYQEMAKERRKEFGEGGKQANKGQMGHPNGGRKMLDQAKSTLDLSKEQNEKWDAIAKSYGDKMRAIKQDDSLDDSQKRSEFKSNKTALEKDLMAILTSEQQASFESFIKENKERRKQERSGTGKKG
jgi:hypothetical protein